MLIPINYVLVIDVDSSSYRYVKGFSYPIIGDQVFVLAANTVRDMHNRKIIEKMLWERTATESSARNDLRIGIIKMFENSNERVPIYIDFENMVRYHFGVFPWCILNSNCE